MNELFLEIMEGKNYDSNSGSQHEISIRIIVAPA